METSGLAQEVEAGRETDALIHERIFGFEVKRHGEPDQWVTLAEPDNPAAGWWFVPCYSSDILAAWDVVEKVRSEWFREIRIEHSGCPSELWDCLIFDGAGVMLARECGETAPLAICRAALKALSAPQQAGA